jgi:YfiH family protein
MARRVYNAGSMPNAMRYALAGPYPCWRGGRGDIEARFVGRGPAADREAILEAIGAPGLAVAWTRQVHGATLREGRPGGCGEGDALSTDESGLALSISTADCVPVLLAAPRRIAAVHAGWRGLVARVLAPAVAALGDPGSIHAWIGPAIGQCCYEVGDEVAAAVVAASTPEIARPGPRGRPLLDLAAAARAQLEAAGVSSIELIVSCTQCDPRWWSYRRDGKGAGRNLALVWRSSTRS